MSAADPSACDGSSAMHRFMNQVMGNNGQLEMKHGPPSAAEALSSLATAAGLTALSNGDQHLLPIDPELTRELQAGLGQPGGSEVSALMNDYSALRDAFRAEGTQDMTLGDLDLDAAYNPTAWAKNFWSQQAGMSPLPHHREYIFHDPAINPFTGVQTGLVEAGIQLFNQGRLDEAVLAFEAEIQRQPTSDAWRWLGSTHAENDEDQTAIICLEQAVRMDDQNLEALLDLGVSYTNELFQDEATKYLEMWMTKHPVYSHIPAQVSQTVARGGVFKTNHERIVAMFQAALVEDSEDPDLYTVLGVIFNLSRDYQSAESAFREALQRDPNNYSLWNKLGATQANSARVDGSKSAVYAYRKAIEYKPTYTRAWVNMGISYSNQSMYDLAAKYYLKALSLNAKAKHIWAYLRIALQCMERLDLIPLVQEQNLEAFRAHFQF